MRDTDNTEWLDAAGFTRLFPLSRRTFWRWIADGQIVAYRPLKKKTLVKRSDVEKLLEGSRINGEEK